MKQIVISKNSINYQNNWSVNENHLSAHVFHLGKWIKQVCLQ